MPNDPNDPKPPAKPDAEEEKAIKQALLDLLDANANGEYPGGEIPQTPEMRRLREDLPEYLETIRKRNAAPSAGGQTGEAPSPEAGPSSRIGPKNPDHPNVNRKPGGRNPE